MTVFDFRQLVESHIAWWVPLAAAFVLVTTYCFYEMWRMR
jgi:hypothetical protein